MKNRIQYILTLIIFLILQIIWFNHIRIFGHYSPIVFVYPLLILPLQKNDSLNLLLAFTSGLLLDLVSNTGGVFAATAVFITYFRKIYFFISKNPAQNIDEIRINKLSLQQKILYFGIFSLMTQILIYSFDAFNIGLVLSKWAFILINSLITLFFIILFDVIFFNSVKK